MKNPNSLIVLAAGLLAASPAHAALLVYDGFDSTVYNAVPGPTGGYKNPDIGPSDALFWDTNTTYNQGVNEVGQGPPVHGFTGRWRYNTNISSSVYARLEASQLSYPGLPTTNGQLNIFRSSGSSTSSKSFSRSFDAGPSTTFGSTLYVGGLIQRTADTTFSMNITFTDGTSTRSFTLAIDAAGFSTLSGSGATAITSDASQWAFDAPQFFVLKLENSVLDGGTSSTDGDRMTLYINPDLSDEGANTESALVLGDEDSNFFVTGNANWSLGNLTIGSSANTNQSLIFDEFKIGTEWADMLAVIPEPSSALLAAMSLLAAVRRRRI